MDETKKRVEEEDPTLLKKKMKLKHPIQRRVSLPKIDNSQKWHKNLSLIDNDVRKKILSEC